ncbi:MAG: chemotaxis protein CheA [Alphaproteobacteria bacterium]|nr:MAG: chemotaxis protein CheA [Alphaproteobacteria bacterium]TAF14126.1 MAG: chemotaxis protein CheA [Alphaproteobacteria bacterium]TAF39056.1 MAG: chemotaxis protein CheA [Alphaproteobacteria bacterium]TAF75198.1 MAG: chemotaxis protein CheA [Alphaproteobacteria bacterium]
MVSLEQFKAGFLTECDELLVDMEAMLMQLTPENVEKETLHAMFRCAHSIKGGSGAFGMDAIMDFTHNVEALLDAMREDRVPVSRAAVDALLQSVDIVVMMVNCARANTPLPDDLGKELAVTLHTLTHMTPKATQIVPKIHADVPLITEKTSSPTEPIASTTIRVDVDKLDKLMNIVGELVIAEAMIKARLNDVATDHSMQLVRGVDELSHHTRDLQEVVMSVRMQSVKSIFSRMPRIVRDVSAQLGKDIVLRTEGEHTEVDKTVIEHLGDPLTHMIRNAVDHGIESPEKRVEDGKPAQGTIVLSATHQSGRIIIEISDDGAGINRERVLSKAKEKGLIPHDAHVSDEECNNIIFMPGFSTAECVSNVSGRGVGMDVVRRNIERLDGTVNVMSQQGKGSVFTVSLPLTLAILDGMIVRVGAEFYVMPIASIIETFRPNAHDIRHVEGHFDVMNVRGACIPVIYLHRLFHIPKAQKDASKALVVLVENGRDRMGIVVDELVGQQQVVIKSLEVNTDPVAGIAGATILGDGRVSLIVDIAQMKHVAAHYAHAQTHMA